MNTALRSLSLFLASFHQRSRITVILLLAGLGLASSHLKAAEPQEFVDGSQVFAVIQNLEADSFKVQLHLCPVEEQPDKTLQVLFSAKDAGNYYLLELAAGRARLFRKLDGVRTLLGESRVAETLPTGPRQLLVKRNPSLLSVALNGRILIQVMDSTLGSGAVGVDWDSQQAVTRAQLQPFSRVYAADDFMRSETTKEIKPWTRIGGEWKLYSILKKIFEVEDKTLQDRLKSRQPEPVRSPNPFSLEGKAKTGGMVTLGHWFWDDYRLQASVNSRGSYFGLVFNYQSKDSYFLLRWVVVSHRSGPQPVELVRVQDGAERVLARAYADSKINQWYKLEVDTQGTRIQVYLDGGRIFDLTESESTGGAIGLYVKGPKATYFDDVRVESKRAFDHQDIKARPSRSRRPVLFGDPKWQKYLLTYRCELPRKRPFEVLVACRDSENHISFSADQNQQLELAEVLLGKRRILARTAHPLKPGQEYQFEIDLLTPGEVKVYVDGVLKLRGHLEGASSGQWGYVPSSSRTVKIRRPEVSFKKEEDLELSPENEIYVEDPFMRHWSSPAGPWVPIDDTYTSFWHHSDFYGRFEVSLPLRNGTRLLFATEAEDLTKPVPNPARGYLVRVVPSGKPDARLVPFSGPGGSGAPEEGSDPKQVLPDKYLVQLYRQGKCVTQVVVEAPAASYVKQEITEMLAPPPSPPNPEPEPKDEILPLEIHRDGHYIWLKLKGKEILSYRDAAPLHGRQMALATGWKMRRVDFYRVHVTRNQVADELFEHAPANWERIGNWRIMNRFSCDPRWSHMAAIDKGTAALWNKYQFAGDFTFEFYIGNKMRPVDIWQWPYFYPRTGDLNAVFCGDGKSLDSGYMLTLAAWDERWSEEVTSLLRKTKILVSSNRELVPRDRVTNPGGRIIPVPWISGGRAIHGAWYYVKIRRRGGLIEVYFDNQLVFTHEDPEPLKGRYLGIWTQNNHIVTARARVSYTRKIVPRRTVVPPAASLAKTVFEDGFERVESLPPAPKISSGTHPSRVFGFESGHQWSNVDKEQGAYLESLQRDKSGKHRALRLINLNVGGSFAAKIPLDGVDLRSLSEIYFEYRLDPTAYLNLYLKIKGIKKKTYFIEFCGSSEEWAGFIPLGRIDPVHKHGRWSRAHFDIASAVEKVLPFGGPLIIEEFKIGSYHEGYQNAGLGVNHQDVTMDIDNFEVVAVGRANAAFSLDFPENADISAFSYSLARHPSARIRTHPLPLERSVQFDNLPNGLWYFLVKTMNSRKEWSATYRFPFQVSAGAHIIHPSTGPEARWGGEPISMTIEPNTAAHPDLSKAQLLVNGKPVILSTNNLDYVPGTHTLSLDLSRSGLAFKNGSVVSFALSLPLASGQSLKSEWTHRVDFALDHRPPPRPRVKQYLVDARFDDSLEGWTPLIQNENHMLRLEHNTRDGVGKTKGCLEAVNYDIGGFMGATILEKSFSPAQYPLLSFHYRIFDPNLSLDLILNPSAVVKRVHFADKNSSRPLLGEMAARANIDGQWHYTEVNLESLLKTQAYHPSMYSATELRLADWDFQSNPPGARYLIDNFQVAPVISTARPYRIDFVASDISSIQGFSYSWAQRSEPFYLKDWQVLGPFENKDDKQWDTDFIGEQQCCIDPRKPIMASDGRRLEWHPLKAGPNSRLKVPAVDLQAVWPGDDRVAYALATVHSPIPNNKVTFYVGQDDGLKVWLNGELIYNRHEHIACAPDQFSFVSELKKGPNQVLIKIDQGVGDWEFTFKVHSYQQVPLPPKKVMTEKPWAEFRHLPEGENLLLVRARDGAGNWSEPANYRFFVDNTPPQWAAPSPAPNSKAASTLFSMPVSDNVAGVDVKGMSFVVDGRTFKPGSPSTDFKASRGQLTWDWMVGRPREQEFVPNGHVFKMKVLAPGDHAGNRGKPLEWVWTMDYSKDKKVPSVPDLLSSTRKQLFFQDFSENIESWSNRAKSTYGAKPERKLRSAAGHDYCLQLTHVSYGGSFDANIWNKPFDAAQYPLIDFDYRIPSYIPLQFMARVGSQWYAVNIYGYGLRYPGIGELKMARDDRWHHISFNLYEMLRKKLPKSKTITVSELIIGTYSSPTPGGGWRYFVDNFTVHGPGPALTALKVKSIDMSGIKAYAYSVDQSSGTTPPGKANLKADGVLKRTKPLAPGLHYIHIRAQDHNNNWGPPLHVPYLVK